MPRMSDDEFCQWVKDTHEAKLASMANEDGIAQVLAEIVRLTMRSISGNQATSTICKISDEFNLMIELLNRAGTFKSYAISEKTSAILNDAFKRHHPANAGSGYHAKMGKLAMAGVAYVAETAASDNFAAARMNKAEDWVATYARQYVE